MHLRTSGFLHQRGMGACLQTTIRQLNVMPTAICDKVPTVPPHQQRVQPTLLSMENFFTQHRLRADNATREEDSGLTIISPGLQCSVVGTTISNPNSISPNLVGTLLTATPNGTYPNDYVIEAQMQQANISSDFGIYFRNQPGSQQGVYTFFIHPNGTWGMHIFTITPVECKLRWCRGQHPIEKIAHSL